MLRRNLLHKPGGPVGAGAAEEHPLAGAGEDKLFLCSGHRHIAQPAFLLHLLRLADGPDAGEDPLLRPHHKDHRKLQPLGGVHRHHHHTVLVGVVAVDVGVQGDLVQKAVESFNQALLLAGPVLQIAVDGGEQLPHVFQPGAVLHGIPALQHHGVSGAGEQLLKEGGQGQLVVGQQLIQLLNQPGKLPQPLGGLLQFRIHHRIVDNGVEGALVPAGQLLGGLHRSGPDPPGGIVDNPGKAQVVLRVVQHGQIGQHVFHLRPVEEPGASDNPVGDAIALKGLLHLVGLGVHPVEDSVVLPPAPLAEALQNLRGHILGLVVLVHGGVQLEHLPRPGPGPQLLALSALVVADHGVGRVQDVPGGAVVLLQPDDPRPLILLFKGEDILDSGPPEAVDGLVVVAHHTEIFIPSRQGRGQQILQIVGVLILVNQYIAEFSLIIFPHVLKALEQPDGVQNNIVKIQGVGLPQPALILHIHVGDPGQPDILRRLALGQVIGGQLHGVLGP